MKLALEYIANVCEGRLSAFANPKRKVIGFYTDNRVADNDKIFLAIRGERVDGNSFVPDLLKNGFCALTDREENLSLNGDCIYVDDVRDALQKLAKNYRENELSDIPIIGITGSVGKTTTKDMVALALSSSLRVHKTQGNSNSQIGLPQTLLATPLDAECAVIELGMSMPGEMERISRCAMPDISIITNIGHSHIENLGTREAIRDEKMKIAAYSKPSAKFILNGDEPLLRSLDVKKERVSFVSLNDSSCECFAKNIIESDEGISFVASIYGVEYDVNLPLQGKHYVINTLFALAVAHLLNIDIKSAISALSKYQSDGKRLYVYEKDGHTVISDCYNASPESMEVALSVLSSKKGRRIAVLGDMLELGKESEPLHRKVAEYVNESCDVLITYGEFAKFIYDDAKTEEKYHFPINKTDELSSFIKEIVKTGDTVLYKASNGMNLSRFIV